MLLMLPGWKIYAENIFRCFSFLKSKTKLKEINYNNQSSVMSPWQIVKCEIITKRCWCNTGQCGFRKKNMGSEGFVLPACCTQTHKVQHAADETSTHTHTHKALSHQKQSTSMWVRQITHTSNTTQLIPTKEEPQPRKHNCHNNS